MRIELFGIARARAGREALEVEAATLGDAMRALARECPGVVPEIVANGRLTDGYLASLNGERFVKDPRLRIGKGDTILVLGAQAGG